MHVYIDPPEAPSSFDPSVRATIRATRTNMTADADAVVAGPPPLLPKSRKYFSKMLKFPKKLKLTPPRFVHWAHMSNKFSNFGRDFPSWKNLRRVFF